MSEKSNDTDKEEVEPYIEYPHERDDNFLQELTNTHYVEKKKLTEKELKKQNNEEKRQMVRFIQDQKREEKIQIRLNKEEDLRQKRENKNINKMMCGKSKHEKVEKEENNSLFDDQPTELMGREKLIIMKKIQQYKILFPKELSKFKLKKKINLEELKVSLEECSALVEINSIDGFILDSILSCIKMCENYSQDSDYDISGLSILLKSNPQFISLAKQLFIRYNVFSNVPIEYQMCMCIISTSYLCIQKNKGKSSINSYLDEKI